MAKKATSKPNSGFSNSLMNSGGSSSLFNRAPTLAGGVRKRGESKDQMQQRLGSYGAPSGSDNSDIDAIFRGIQGTRGMVRRGYSGQPLNPDGTDPGNSFDRFMKQNPHLQGAAERQAQYDQQARADMPDRLRSAVAERKALQAMQQPDPNIVTGADGYRTIFDGKGNVVGTTRPMQSKANWSKDNAINRGTASGAERADFRSALQDTGMQSATSEIMGPPVPKGLNMIFPGQSSPPGGASGDRVGSPKAPGEPGGETMSGQMPEFSNRGMPVNYNRELGYGPNIGPQPNWNASLGYNQPNQGPQPNWNAAMNYLPNSGPQQYLFGPNEGPQRPADFGPQLPNSSGKQLMALKRLYGFGGNNNPTLTALEGLWSNLFPGNDYDYLQQLFPGLVHPSAGSGQLMTELAKMYQNPAYQALFPQVNQSEFYK